MESAFILRNIIYIYTMLYYVIPRYMLVLFIFLHVYYYTFLSFK